MSGDSFPEPRRLCTIARKSRTPFSLRSQRRELLSWREEHGHEIDFVFAVDRKRPTVIECKWSANNFQPRNLATFRRQHPFGENVVLSHDIDKPFTRTYGDLRIRFESIRSFAASISV